MLTYVSEHTAVDDQGWAGDRGRLQERNGLFRNILGLVNTSKDCSLPGTLCYVVLQAGRHSDVFYQSWRDAVNGYAWRHGLRKTAG